MAVTSSLALLPMSSASIHNNMQVQVSYKAILQMGLPIAAAILVPQLNFVTNNIFLGHYGQQALALAGITGVYYLIFAVMGNGLNGALQSLISRRAGENRLDEIGNLFSQGIRIAIVLSVLGILLTWFIVPTLLGWALHDAKNVQMAVEFLHIRIWGLPFLYLYQMRNAVLVGTNQSKYLIIGTATEALSNVFFDYTLIFGKLGLPALGFNGAAWASVISEGIGLLVTFLVIHFKGISRQLNLFKHWDYHAANTKLILVQALPLIGQFALSIIAWELFYILIEHHGQLSLAVSNAMRNIFGVFGCFTWAFASATNAMVSNVIGQGMQHRVIELIHKIIHVNFGFVVMVCVLLNLFPATFLSVYGQGPAFVDAAIPVLRVVSSALVLMSISVVWLNAVVGTGNTKINLFSELIAIVVYSLYVYLVLEKWQLSILYGWASEWLYWLCLLIPSYWYMKSGKWKHTKV
jgi:putative MATE family efflux protein